MSCGEENIGEMRGCILVQSIGMYESRILPRAILLTYKWLEVHKANSI